MNARAPDGGEPPTVFFLSDYGLRDEFVGVVHAVIRKLVPSAAVVDLTHGVTPFDVRAGAQTLLRAVPHLGAGTVLAVVDPGVGTERRGVAVEGRDGRWFVGPDNGLVVPAAEAFGGIARAVSLAKPAGVPDTFDGRDVFAPAAATLALGRAPDGLGELLDPAGLVRLPQPVLEPGSVGDRRSLRAEVTWIDRFGNVQLAAGSADGPSERGAVVEVRMGGAGGGRGSGGGRSVQLSARRVRAFGDLRAGELGLLVDANGRLALAVSQGSAAEATGAVEGGVVELIW